MYLLAFKARLVDSICCSLGFWAAVDGGDVERVYKEAGCGLAVGMAACTLFASELDKCG